VDKTAAAQSAQGRLIPDGEPDLRFLDVLDGHFKIRFEGLGYPDPIFPGKVAFEDVELDAKLDAGNLLLNRLWSTGERGEAVASGRLTRKGRIVSIDWQLQARDFRLGLLGTAGNLDELPAHKIDLELTSRGRTYRDHAASVNGRLFMTGGSGRSNNTALNRVYGSFFDELITTVNPFAKQEKHTKIECTAAAMAIQAGVIRLDPGAVTRTDKIDISLGGTIDLKKEVVDMQFRNAPRKGIGLSAAGLVRPFIKVGGPLKQPDIQLDPGKALLSGTAAVATSGLSLIASSLFDRLSTATNPCEKIIAEADIKRHPKPAKKPHAD
jgi:hypothetical protein